MALVATAMMLFTRFNNIFVQDNPGGEQFLVHWVSTRAFVTDGLSPYSEETNERIQAFADQTLTDPTGPLVDLYPIYAMVVYLPFALIADYEMARAVWMTLLELSIVLIIPLSIRLAGWRSKLWMYGLFTLFSVGLVHTVRALVTGDIIILLTLVFLGGLVALRAGMDELAGILFALTTIKPQLFILPLLFIGIWCLNNRRYRMFAWLIGMGVLFSALGALFLPDWILQNLRQLVSVFGVEGPMNFQKVLSSLLPGVGSRLGWVVAVILAILMLAEWWIFRRADERGFYWALVVTLAATQWIGVPTSPDNFILLLPGLALVFGVWEDRWRTLGTGVVIFSMVLLGGGLWLIYTRSGGTVLNVVPAPELFLPLPAFLLVMLYWVRWWAVRSPTLWIDWMYQQENPRR
jgi:hypothetical protein